MQWSRVTVTVRALSCFVVFDNDRFCSNLPEFHPYYWDSHTIDPIPLTQSRRRYDRRKLFTPAQSYHISLDDNLPIFWASSHWAIRLLNLAVSSCGPNSNFSVLLSRRHGERAIINPYLTELNFREVWPYCWVKRSPGNPYLYAYDNHPYIIGG